MSIRTISSYKGMIFHLIPNDLNELYLVSEELLQILISICSNRPLEIIPSEPRMNQFRRFEKSIRVMILRIVLPELIISKME